MKKIGLFVLGICLVVIATTNTQCRKPVDDTPIDTTQTIVTPPKDTSGEDLIVDVYQDQVTTGAQPASGATIWIINNHQDYVNWSNNHSYPHYTTSKYLTKGQCQPGDNQYTFSRVKPSSINPTHIFTGPGGGVYEYHVIAEYVSSPGDTLTGEYMQGGNGATVNINQQNGTNGKGVEIPIAVIR